MSSSQDPQETEVEEAEEVVAMDTAETPVAADTTAATSIWDIARQNSSKMVLQSVLDDMEDGAAKQKNELQQLRRRAEDAEASLAASREAVEKYEASLLLEKETKKELEKTIRVTSLEKDILKELSETEKERADRSGSESDRLREEIRYVLVSQRWKLSVVMRGVDTHPGQLALQQSKWAKKPEETNVLLFLFFFVFQCKSNYHCLFLLHICIVIVL